MADGKWQMANSRNIAGAAIFNLIATSLEFQGL
jgi:hypothetical protein